MNGALLISPIQLDAQPHCCGMAPLCDMVGRMYKITQICFRFLGLTFLKRDYLKNVLYF